MSLEARYRELPAQGSVVLTCAPAELAATLLAAEKAGFHGLRIERGDVVRITAHKGKAGPCYDTGRTARYRGSAAAALDDDNHLLAGRLRVCEKTGRIYGSPAYREWVEVSEADPGLLGRLESNPAPFDCDTFELDAKALAATLAPAAKPAGERLSVFYPGPFKLLILADGTMVRRGVPVQVVADRARELVRLDGAAVESGTAAMPSDFLALYRERGAACLLGELPMGSEAAPKHPADLRALSDASLPMRRRLEAMIARKDEYFILTGSDPAQKDGCCPSNEVGEANRLVQAGVLQSLSSNASAACPTTIYAFAGEIRRQGERPEFSKNAELRGRALDYLKHGPGVGRKLALQAALWIVMIAAVITLGWGLVRQLRGR